MKCWCIIIIPVLALVLTSAQVCGFAYAQDLHNEKPDSCYIVLATDISGSMNKNDPLVTDQEGKLQAIRDDAQLTFLQLLEHLRTRHYVGICKFTDKITYGLPGGSRKTVKQSQSLLDWQETSLDWETLRKQLSTKKAALFRGTRINEAIEWSYQRILLARKWCNDDGPGVLVVLTDGDPDNALKELSPRGGPVLRTADKLASENIRVYPIIINTASYQLGRAPSGLDSKNKAAERLMELVAAKTDGKAYRITATFGLLDIFLDILNINLPDIPAPTEVEKSTGSFVVSKHHRTAILIGPALESIRLEPFDGKASRKPYSLSLMQGLDSTSGIVRKIIPLAKWNIVILRRPESLDSIEDFWCGRWRPVVKGSTATYQGRVYLITDFLLHMDVEPTSPSWAHELIQIKARLMERPKELGEHDFDVPPLKGKDLSVRLDITRDGGGEPIEIKGGRWDQHGQVYMSVPFHLSNPGRYSIICDCADHVDGLEIPLGQFSRIFSVEPCPVSLTLRKPPTYVNILDGKSQQSSSKVGDQLHAELKVIEGGVRLDALSGLLYLDNVEPQKWPFKHDVSGGLITDTFVLPKNDYHLVGHAEVKVKTPIGVRQMQLPNFDIPYNPEPLHLEQHFSDLRKALWVGEFHRQKMSIAIFPVFERRIINSMPQELPEVNMNVFDDLAGTSKAIPVRCSLKEPPQQIGDKSRRIKATYTLKSDIPIPPSNRCEIDPGIVIAGLRAEKAYYGVIDPIKDRIFVWHVFQEPSEASTPGVANEIYQSEPIRFAAEWEPNQNVSRVSFEVHDSNPEQVQKVSTVDLPIAVGTTSSQIERNIDGLQRDKTYKVFVYVTLRPPDTDIETNLRLYGGSFNVKDRELELKELVVGYAGKDISCHALEEVELPLRASFTGYVVGNPRHSKLIKGFKESCKLLVTNENGDEDISNAIEWTRVQPPISTEGTHGTYWFEGYARYTPRRVGRASVEFSGEVEVWDPDGKLRSVRPAAYGRLLIKEPRFTLKVKEIPLSGEGEKLLFDSDKLVAGQAAVFPVSNSFETHLRVFVQFAETAFLPRYGPCKTGVMIICRPPSGGSEKEVFLQRSELTADKQSMEMDFPGLGKEEGDYYVHLFTIDTEPHHPKIDLITPPLVSIGKIEVVRLIPPPGFLTERVRQWPFRYHVPIQPDWSFHPTNLAFEFQLPGIKDRWLDGVLSASDGMTYLVARSLEYLPKLTGITSGDVQFRLRYMDADCVTWKTRSSVRVVAPRLEGVLLIYERDGRKRESEEATLSVDAPVSVAVRPKFREAPELEEWWSKKEIKIYKCLNPRGDLGDRKVSSKVLKELAERDIAGQVGPDHDIQVFLLKDNEDLLGKKIIDEAEGSNCFWGLPRFRGQDKYVILISATYEEKYATGSIVTMPGNLLEGHLITEWSDPYQLIVNKPRMPYVWWLIVILSAVGVWVRLLKIPVPFPEHLGLDVRLMSENAIIEPISNHPMLANIQQTSLCSEFLMYSQYLHSRLGIAGTKMLTQIIGISSRAGAVFSSIFGNTGEALLYIFAALRVLLGRLFLARRWTLITVRPKIKEGAKNVQVGLVRIRTGLVNKDGRLWSSETGWENLPDKGEAKKIVMNLSFKMENVERNMPVTLQVRRQ